MPFLQWVDGQKQFSQSPLGADFAEAVFAIQSVSRSFQDLKKLSPAKVLMAIENFISSIQDLKKSSFFSEQERLLFLSKSKKILNLTHQQIPLGPSLIYGTRSSPLVRMIPVLHSLSQRSPVVFLCSPATAEAYIYFCEKLVESGLPASVIGIVSSKDPESLETLISHPSLKSIHFQGHSYEGDFLKKSTLPLFQKKMKIHLGSKNPVIFTHDADLELLQPLLLASLRTDYFSEHRFHRWFVQEKNYSAFIEKVESLYPHIATALPRENAIDTDYAETLKLQNSSLLKEKNWKRLTEHSLLFNSDFNNCSPWHQQETLGSVLTITRYKNSAEAIKFANTTQFASASVVISSSVEKSKEVSAQLTMPHHFLNEVPDIGALDTVLGLSGCGFGNEIPDANFFSF